jgi:hypothetical protein
LTSGALVRRLWRGFWPVIKPCAFRQGPLCSNQSSDWSAACAGVTTAKVKAAVVKAAARDFLANCLVMMLLLLSVNDLSGVGCFHERTICGCGLQVLAMD